MDTSGEVADLMVREGIQLTEESVKLLAAGSKNLAALLWALARDEKKLVGKTGMARLIREGKELKVFRLKESDLEEFKKFAKKNVLFSVVKDTKATDGLGVARLPPGRGRGRRGRHPRCLTAKSPASRKSWTHYAPRPSSKGAKSLPSVPGPRNLKHDNMEVKYHGKSGTNHRQ